MVPTIGQNNVTEWAVPPHSWILKDDNGNDDSCKVRDLENNTIICEKWKFNRTYFEDTRTTQVIIEYICT